MPAKEPIKVPDIQEWVDKLPEGPTKTSAWDARAEEIRTAPGTGWAVMERPEPWNSSFPTWFRKRYKDLDLHVPAVTKVHTGPKLMYMRRKPLAPSPADRR